MPPHNPKIGVIILAAGASSRMRGERKQLLAINGKSLLRRAAETAVKANFNGVEIVLGAYAEKLREEIEDLPVGITVNEHWADGVGSSIKAGLSALAARNFDAVLVMLCDQPLITAEILRRLRARFIESGKALAACRYRETVGVPALFGRALFGELMQLRDDEGAKKIIKKLVSETAFVDAEDAAIDVDTPEDFEKLKSLRLAND